LVYVRSSGTTPAVIETNGTRKNRSIYGFLNLKTGKEHAFATMRQTMHETAEERHEAPLDRVEMKGLHLGPVAAGL
jgi:hypothetical protein